MHNEKTRELCVCRIAVRRNCLKCDKESQAKWQGVGWYLCSQAGMVDDNLFHKEQRQIAEIIQLDGECQIVW